MALVGASFALTIVLAVLVWKDGPAPPELLLLLALLAGIIMPGLAILAALNGPVGAASRRAIPPSRAAAVTALILATVQFSGWIVLALLAAIVYAITGGPSGGGNSTAPGGGSGSGCDCSCDEECESCTDGCYDCGDCCTGCEDCGNCCEDCDCGAGCCSTQLLTKRQGSGQHGQCSRRMDPYHRFAHHPVKPEFAADVYAIGRWRLCVGCFTTYPVFLLAASALITLQPPVDWLHLAVGGTILATCQSISSLGKATRKWSKICVKTALGTGLAAVVAGVMASPLGPAGRAGILAAFLALAVLSTVPRARRMHLAARATK